MANRSARQNPSNKVGRYSGAGEGGISELRPSERQAEAGVEPIGTISAGQGAMRLLSFGAVALVGTAIATAVLQQARKPRTLLDRLTRLVGR